MEEGSERQREETCVDDRFIDVIFIIRRGDVDGVRFVVGRGKEEEEEKRK